jgi:hypothetical protein
MSGIKVVDGTGGGHSTKVDSTNRLHVKAANFSGLEVFSAELGESYYLISDFVTLTTTGSYNGMLYIKNTSNKNLHIAYVRTCGTQVQQWKLTKQPTTGTLISGASAANQENLNFTSGNSFGGLVYKGADATTITDGTLLAQWINGAGHSNTNMEGAIILGNGDSLALSCQPAVAGTFCVTVLAYYEE